MSLHPPLAVRRGNTLIVVAVTMSLTVRYCADDIAVAPRLFVTITLKGFDPASDAVGVPLSSPVSASILNHEIVFSTREKRKG